jgi:hypothetical protein
VAPDALGPAPRLRVVTSLNQQQEICMPTRFAALGRFGLTQLAPRIVVLTLIGLPSAAVHPAAAQNAASAQPRIMQVCRNDIRTVCADVQPGGGRVKQCMSERYDKLSDACRSAIMARKQ